VLPAIPETVMVEREPDFLNRLQKVLSGSQPTPTK
jgi:hypothetical protein